MNIRLKPLRKGSEVISSLFMESEEIKDLFQSFRQHNSTAAVLSDVLYELEIEGEFDDLPIKVEIYLDDEKVDMDMSYTENNTIRLVRRPANKAVFCDCYGFIQIKVEMHYQDDVIETLYSDYFQVLLPDNDINRSMQKMAEFVYENHAKYLLDKGESTENESFGAVESIDSQVGIIREVVQVYIRNLPFFKANAHTKAEYRYSVQDVEKLRVVNSTILRYICLHPDQLAPAEKNVNIRQGEKSYLPKKTLVLETERVRNTYENRVTLSFIYLVLEESDRLNKRLKQELEEVGKYESYEGYISSAKIILKGVEDRLKRASEELSVLGESLREMYLLYSEFLEAKLIRLDRVPDATGVMRTSAPYRSVFECIVKWFSKGTYRFYNESLMLPLMLNHHLYEYYVLLKLIKMLENEDYKLDIERSKNYHYPIQNRNYIHTNHYNTLYFGKRNESIILYYQPVIWGQLYREEISNGIRIRRSTSYRIKNSTPVNNAFWSPDYLLKYQAEGKENYLILDAKYSEKLSFLADQMSDLAYKYTFAIQPLDKAKYVGECVLYGKGYYADCIMQNVHDIYQNNQERIYWFLSLSEGKADEASHMRELSKLIPVLTA